MVTVFGAQLRESVGRHVYNGPKSHCRVEAPAHAKVEGNVVAPRRQRTGGVGRGRDHAHASDEHVEMIGAVAPGHQARNLRLRGRHGQNVHQERL